jgi:hypothetical protein
MKQHKHIEGFLFPFLERCSQGLSPYQNRLVDPRLFHLLPHLFHSSILPYTALGAWRQSCPGPGNQDNLPGKEWQW